MPSYDISYWNADGSLAAKLKAECADDREAKILAHALMEKGRARFRVWKGSERELVYQRPLVGTAFG